MPLFNPVSLKAGRPQYIPARSRSPILHRTAPKIPKNSRNRTELTRDVSKDLEKLKIEENLPKITDSKQIVSEYENLISEGGSDSTQPKNCP